MRSTLVGAGLAAHIAFVSLAHAADVVAGKEKAEMCIACHGEGGVSQLENTPSLAGQPEEFMQWQLVFFRAGIRKNDQMQPVVGPLSNEDIRNLSAYFASLTPPKGKQDDNPDLSRKGAQAAADRGCVAYHGDYSGGKAVPRLAGQRQDYLLKALHDYKSGGSGGLPRMESVAVSLSEEEIEALAHYLAHLAGHAAH